MTIKLGKTEAVITFNNEDDAETAVGLFDGQELNGNIISITLVEDEKLSDSFEIIPESQ